MAPYNTLKIAVIVLVLTLIPFVSAAVTCTGVVDKEIPQGTEATMNLACKNSVNSNSVTLTKSGSASNYFSLSQNLIGASSNTTETSTSITVTFDKTAPNGTFVGTIGFSDGSAPLSFIMRVNPPADQTIYSTLKLFPTSKIVTVQQGGIKSQSITLTVPQTYPRMVTIQSVDLNPGTETITFGDLSLGQVAPGESVSIPIEFSGKDAQTGTYSTELSVFAIDSQGQVNLPKVSLQLQVTAGVTPTTADTFTSAPNCALSSTSLNVNQTYTFTCTNVNSNIQINTLYNQFYQGITTDTTSNIYTYSFKPIQYGNTNFTVYFTSRGLQVFAPFNQEIRISSEGMQVPGTELDFLFTPALSSIKPKDTVAINIIDKKTQSIVSNSDLLIDAVPITNKSGPTFFYILDNSKNYTFRAIAPGYANIIREISLLYLPIEIIVTPESGNDLTLFNITTNANATIFINNENKGTEFIGTLPGMTSAYIKAYREGYLDSFRNLTIEESVRISTTGELKKGVSKVFTLNKNDTWTVYYQKDLTSTKESVSTGVGDKIEYEPKSSGYYTIETSQGGTWSGSIEGMNWQRKYFGFAWYIWVVLFLILIVIYAYRKNGHSTSSPEAFQGGPF